MASEPRTVTASSSPPTTSDVERRPARYLFAISVLADASTDRISTGKLREDLDVSPASVTEMLSKLDDRGLVDYEKYRGVTLTDQGASLAADVGWRYCVVSTFFETVLDAPIDEETAFDVGFLLPKPGVFRLRELVDSACLGLCPETSEEGDGCVA